MFIPEWALYVFGATIIMAGLYIERKLNEHEADIAALYDRMKVLPDDNMDISLTETDKKLDRMAQEFVDGLNKAAKQEK